MNMINNTSHKKEKNREKNREKKKKKKTKIELLLKHENKTEFDKINTGMIFFSFLIKF